MSPRDDPMRSQRLSLGAEAFPGWSELPDRHHGNHPVTSAIGNTLLGLALMFSGNANADLEPTTEQILDGTSFTLAMQHYEDCRWHEAYSRFSRLADNGHRDAARMAWQMWRYGAELFGIEFQVDAERRYRWLAAWRGAPSQMRPSQTTAALD